MNENIVLYNDNLKSFYYDDLINLGNGKYRVRVYKEGKFKYDRIIIKTPRCKLAYDPNKNKYNSLSLLLHPLSNELKEFYKLIKRIDKKNKQNLQKENIKYKSCVTKTKYGNKIAQFNMFENCQIFSKSKKKKKLKDISLDDEVSLFIELNHLWISGKKAGCNWNIIQIRYYQSSFNINKCMFLSDTEDSDDEVIVPPKKSEIKYVQKCLHCQSVSHCLGPRHDLYNNPINNLNLPIHNHTQPPLLPSMLSIGINSLKSIKNVKKNNNKPSRPVMKSFFPSVKDILNIKNKLKKTKSKSILI
jgi:hypothetical protein